MTFFRKTGYIRSANRRQACSVAVEVDWHENGLHCFGPVERLLSDNMNHFDDLSEVVDISPSGQCRKRVLQPSAPNDAMLVAKWARHSGGDKIPAKACKHDAENGDFCQVEKLSDAHRSFGSSNSKYSEYFVFTCEYFHLLHKNGWLICKIFLN